MIRCPAFLFLAVILVFPCSSVKAADLSLPGVQADYVLVEKAARRLTLFAHDKAIRTYRVALGRDPKGPKLKKGDHRTPEGTYMIDAHNPDSKYHLSLHISYPNEIDREVAAMAGLVSGGGIMIHGTGEEYAWMGRFHTVNDWTDGCIAVTDKEIEEIWQLVPDGTTIKIRP